MINLLMLENPKVSNVLLRIVEVGCNANRPRNNIVQANNFRLDKTKTKGLFDTLTDD